MNKRRKTLIKLDEINVRGGELLFKQLFLRANATLSTTIILFLFSFSSLLSGRSFTLYSFFLNYPNRTLVYHLSPYSSIRPIKHLLWLSVNGGGWDCTVQRSSPHKCSQKSCCSAFNAVVGAFAFRYFCVLCMCLKFILIAGSPWRVT